VCVYIIIYYIIGTVHIIQVNNSSGFATTKAFYSNTANILKFLSGSLSTPAVLQQACTPSGSLVSGQWAGQLQEKCREWNGHH